MWCRNSQSCRHQTQPLRRGPVPIEKTYAKGPVNLGGAAFLSSGGSAQQPHSDPRAYSNPSRMVPLVRKECLSCCYCNNRLDAYTNLGALTSTHTSFGAHTSTQTRLGSNTSAQMFSFLPRVHTFAWHINCFVKIMPGCLCFIVLFRAILICKAI